MGVPQNKYNINVYQQINNEQGNLVKHRLAWEFPFEFQDDGTMLVRDHTER